MSAGTFHGQTGSHTRAFAARPRLRLALGTLIGWLPTNTLRIAAYRLVMGYRFGSGVRLGHRVTIAVHRFEIGDESGIRRSNSFVGPITVEIGKKVFIGRYNKIECGESAASPSVSAMNYSRTIRFGDECLINEGHLFDVLGLIAVGKGTWVAGFASQFLTHGASAMDRDITIGERCFLGSAVRFAPGSGLGNDVVLGMGSVVTKRVEGDMAVVAGVPARMIKQRSTNDVYRFTRTW